MDGGRDIVQEAVIKTIPNKKKCKNIKRLYEEALQIAEKRREVKGKARKSYTLTESRGLSRRDMKAFLNE